MRLDEHNFIEPDIGSWTLVYEKLGEINPETGKPIKTRRVSHHGQLQYALRQFVDESLVECKDIQEVLDKFAELHAKFDSFCADKTWATLKQLRKNDVNPAQAPSQTA